jgi:hypothetical protein
MRSMMARRVTSETSFSVDGCLPLANDKPPLETRMHSANERPDRLPRAKGNRTPLSVRHEPLGIHPQRLESRCRDVGRIGADIPPIRLSKFAVRLILSAHSICGRFRSAEIVAWQSGTLPLFLGRLRPLRRLAVGAALKCHSIRDLADGHRVHPDSSHRSMPRLIAVALIGARVSLAVHLRP